jgi:polyribonucleotide nucleotidyltransferase
MIAMVIECPQAIVGRVIGSSGATIKEVQSRTGAKIQIDQNFPEGIHSNMYIYVCIYLLISSKKKI